VAEACHCEERSDEAISMGIASPPARNDRGTLVIGIGNPDRGDDAVGCVVAGMLRDCNVPAVQLSGEATALMAALESVDRVWLIDAAQSGEPCGTIHRIDCATTDVPPRGAVSSHGFGVAEAIGLARALGTLPPHCIVYAIEAADFTPGAPSSPEVTRAAQEVAERILAELATPPRPSTHRQLRPAPAPDRQ
jgi:hydrogenase maturation protease